GGGLFRRLLAGEVVQRRLHFDMVVAGFEVEPADDGDDGGIPGLGDLGGGQQRSRRDIEEGQKGGACRAEVHVRQVVHRDAVAQVADQAAHAIVAADQVYGIESTPAFAHDGVHIFVALPRVHGG